MQTPIYENSCNECGRDLMCHLCRQQLCAGCSIQLNDEYCCRPCSVSLRDDEYLVSYFINWHRNANLGEVRLAQAPELLRDSPQGGTVYSQVEFEVANVIGSVIYRSDAQCDADALVVTTGRPLFISYRILVSEKEIDEFLTSMYAYVQSSSI